MFHVKRSETAVSDVSRETLDRLRIYEALLRKWNATINLIGRAGSAMLWQRHVEDSLQLLPLMPPHAELAVDMGSGAGFPGLVLAIASGVHFHLLEADQRKAAFLREAAAATGAPVTVHAARIADVRLGLCDLLTARAFGPLTELLALGSRFLQPNGTALFHKGAKAEGEILEACQNWRMTLSRHGSTTDVSGVILKITGICRVAA